MVANAGARITLVFLIPGSAGHLGSKVDQKTHAGNQNQVQEPTESFLAQRNRRFLLKCARWSTMPHLERQALISAIDEAFADGLAGNNESDRQAAGRYRCQHSHLTFVF